MIAGDFNFVTDLHNDKIGGNPDKGDGGRDIQGGWEKNFHVTDAWRKANPTTIATT